MTLNSLRVLTPAIFIRLNTICYTFVSASRPFSIESVFTVSFYCISLLISSFLFDKVRFCSWSKPCFEVTFTLLIVVDVQAAVGLLCGHSRPVYCPEFSNLWSLIMHGKWTLLPLLPVNVIMFKQVLKLAKRLTWKIVFLPFATFIRILLTWR